jgi:uncharacterized protein (DUF2141 family)
LEIIPAFQNAADKQGSEGQPAQVKEPEPGKPKVIHANGVPGFVLHHFEDEGTVVFRVYDAEQNFTDYIVRHSDLRTPVNDEEPYFYAGEEPLDQADLNHSPAILGNSATQSVKPQPAKPKITSANGVTGMILSLHDGEGTVVFRVYDAEHNFIDYTLNHSDLKVTINDEDAFFYESEDPERASLDHSPATLGHDVPEAKG